jgi:hypothetical protein
VCQTVKARGDQCIAFMDIFQTSIQPGVFARYGTVLFLMVLPDSSIRNMFVKIL